MLEPERDRAAARQGGPLAVDEEVAIRSSSFGDSKRVLDFDK